MKFLKLSLAASVALGAFSTASFAQPLEEAIRGIDVSGYLRYRYNDDRYSDAEFHKNEVDGPKSKSKATHRWKAVADFKTPVVNNIGLNFGILYNNESNNVNHGNGSIPNTTATPDANRGLGGGLGSGKDGSFGVSTFYATIAPDSTATTILIGKQRLATPVTNAGDDDRGTGILALNSDLEGFTFAAGAFDSWSIDDVSALRGYDKGGNDGLSAAKPLYVLAGIYGVDTAYGRFGGQLWGFYIQDAVDALGVGELTWDGSTFNAALQYALAKLDNSDSSLLGHTALNGTTLVGTKNRANIAEANDLFVFNVGADFANDFGVPLDVKLGYVTNFQDGTAVTLNDDGTIFKYAGALWWQNSATGVSTSALGVNNGVHGFGTEQDLSVFYGAIGYRMVDERLRIGLDYVWGNSEVQRNGVRGKEDIDFQEITPRFSWKHTNNLTISGYYAYLMTDKPDYLVRRAGDQDLRNNNTKTDEDRQRVRLEVKYSF